MNFVLHDRKATMIMLLPALVVYTAIILIPIFWSIGYTTLDGNAISGFQFVGFSNYIKFFQDTTALQALWFTVRYALLLTVLQVACGYGLAILYVFYLQNKSSWVRTIIFFPVVLPTVAVALMFSRIFEAAPSTGPINTIIEFLGFHGPDWLGDASHSFWVIIMMDLWRSMGFYAILLYAGLVEIPTELLEAGRIDGASGRKLIRHIVVPLSLPILLSAVIFSVNGTLKVFDTIVALTNGGPGTATTPLTLLMFRTSFGYGEYGYGSTIAMMLTLMCLLVTVFIFRSMRKDVTKS